MCNKQLKILFIYFAIYPVLIFNMSENYLNFFVYFPRLLNHHFVICPALDLMMKKGGSAAHVSAPSAYMKAFIWGLFRTSLK